MCSSQPSPGRGVKHLARLQLLLPGHPLGALRKVILAVVIIPVEGDIEYEHGWSWMLQCCLLDEEDSEGPEHDTAEEGDCVQDQTKVALQLGTSIGRGTPRTLTMLTTPEHLDISSTIEAPWD